MAKTSTSTGPRWFVLGATLGCCLTSFQDVMAADSSPEREQLVAITRQLDMLERTARHSASLARDERARYHFDYARLQQDIERIRAGVRDYLAPPRAQPRDPVVMVGDYRRSAEAREAP